MHNKKGENNNSGNHIPWGSRGFFFEDYETPKYEYKQQSRFSEVKLSLNRVSFTLIFLGFVFGYLGFGKLVFYLMTLQFSKFVQDRKSVV